LFKRIRLKALSLHQDTADNPTSDVLIATQIFEASTLALVETSNK